MDNLFELQPNTKVKAIFSDGSECIVKAKTLASLNYESYELI